MGSGASASRPTTGSDSSGGRGILTRLGLRPSTGYSLDSRGDSRDSDDSSGRKKPKARDTPVEERAKVRETIQKSEAKERDFLLRIQILEEQVEELRENEGKLGLIMLTCKHT
jgi:hypothetical protein